MRDASPAGDAAIEAGPFDAALPPDAMAAADAMPAADDEDAGPDTGVTRDRAMLIDHTRWELLDADADPFDDLVDAEACDEARAGTAFGYEDFVGEAAFFVNTASCGYLAVQQPSLRAVRAGELVNVRLWHFPLTAPADSEAHVGVRLGDALLFEDRIPIPSSSELLTARWMAPVDIPAGEPVLLHLHNHGANEYLLIEISAGPR